MPGISPIGLSDLFIPGIPGMAMGTDSPRAANHRCMNLISSDCELLIRAPSEVSSLLSVCEAMSAVISIAWEWCMIMPCMNSTSACDRGGSKPFVDAGSVLLGLPGAPGCTITGLAGSFCCEPAGQQKKNVQPPAASMPPHSSANFLAARTPSHLGKVWSVAMNFKS
jgi:hypothetical protein